MKVIHKENGGLVDASIVDINNSSGECICFLNPDDYVGAHFIENFIQQFDEKDDLISSVMYQ